MTLVKAMESIIKICSAFIQEINAKKMANTTVNLSVSTQATNVPRVAKQVNITQV